MIGSQCFLLLFPGFTTHHEHLLQAQSYNTPFPGYHVLSSSKRSDVFRSWCKLHTGAEINPNLLVLTQKDK